MKLTGRILYLSNCSDIIRQQISGIDLQKTPELHYGVNTDLMISGAACTLGYTEDVLGPHFLVGFKGEIAIGDIQKGGFQVAVGGETYGSGSSREVAVVAHRGAGIALVIAKSFQRIFQENLVYCGLPFTTDFSIIENLRAGKKIDTDALTQALPPFFQAVAEAGGLLHYGSKLLAKKIKLTYDVAPAVQPMTCIEKIVAQKIWPGHTGFVDNTSVHPGDQVLCHVGFRGMHEYTAGMVMSLYKEEWGDAPVTNPELVAAFEDHFVLIDSATVPQNVKQHRLEPSKKLTQEMMGVCRSHHIRQHGPHGTHAAGVCHRLVVEEYALPGTLIVLTDSHTPTAGVLNAFAFGVGSTAMAFALRTGLIPVTVPKTIRVVVEGITDGVLSPKDFILHLIGDPYFREEQWRQSPTDTCAIQFGGPGLKNWNVDELSVLTNMTVEGGLMTGIIEPCDAIATFLKKRRGVDAAPLFIYPDDDATYHKTIRVNLADVPLSVATPGDSRNRKPLDEVTDVMIHNVVIASCTGGSLSDLRAAAKILQGKQLHPGVRLTVTPSSESVASMAQEEGLLAIFHSVGAVVSAPGCGACIGNGPGIPAKGETTASTTNRNFDRRMGAPGPVYLVSPAVAAATAITGKLTDPRDLPQ